MASTSEILAALTLPGGDSERQVGSAEISVSERWREFVRLYGDEADVARLVRGAALPIGGEAVITIGLETLLGIGDDGGGGLVPSAYVTRSKSYSELNAGPGNRSIRLDDLSESQPNEAYRFWRIIAATFTVGAESGQDAGQNQAAAFMTGSTFILQSIRIPAAATWGEGNVSAQNIPLYSTELLSRPTPRRERSGFNRLWFSIPNRTFTDFALGGATLHYTLEWT